MTSTSRLLLLSVLLIRETPSTDKTDWSLLCETIIALSKKHGQLKSAITKMVQLAMCFLKSTSEQHFGPSATEEDVNMEDEKPAAEDSKKDEKKEKKADKEIDREGQEDKEVTKLIQEAKQIGDKGLKEDDRMKLVETLRTVTEGKVSFPLVPISA